MGQSLARWAEGKKRLKLQKLGMKEGITDLTEITRIIKGIL